MLAVSFSLRYIVIGNGVGVIGKLDLRIGKLPFCYWIIEILMISGKVLNTYKGSTGSIRCVRCHQTLPIVAACGLDGFVRVYNLEDKKLLHKVCYLCAHAILSIHIVAVTSRFHILCICIT